MIFRAVRLERSPIFRFANSLKKLFFSLFIFSVLLFALSSVSQSFSQKLSLSGLVIFLVVAVLFWEIFLFFNLKIKKPKLKNSISEAILNPEKFNLADFLDFETAKNIWQTIKFCKKRKISEITTTALLYFLLKENAETGYIFIRLGVDLANLQESLKNSLEKLERTEKPSESFAQDFKDTIIGAMKIAEQRNYEKIGLRQILVSISKNEFFKQILIDNDLGQEDIENLTLWLDFLERRIEERKKFWEYDNLLAYGSLAKDWAAGYTVILDQFSIDWTKIVRHWNFKAIVGHEKEIEQVQRVLIRPEVNNVLLVGEPGTGRESIVQAIARRSYLGRCAPELNYNRTIELDMVSLLSRITNPEDVENILDRIFQEVISAGNVILVIKEFHNYVAVGNFKPGAIDISGVIGKYLNYPQFKLIAITDYTGLHTRIEQNPSLLNLFEKIEVSEVSEEETIRILANLSLELENKYKVFVTYPAMREVVNLSSRYLPNLPFPKKAKDILNEVVTYVARVAKEKVVLPRHVAKIISEKTQIPSGKVDFKEKELLLNLEELIHQKIVNQDQAVIEVSTALRRARAGIASKKRPMGNFLFLGPTGVGKTETSKALAEIYFGGEQRMIRLDMSEFQAITDIPRLIGTLGQEGLLTTPVRENPFSLVLLDEIEKAHPNILNLFLQVFDEGHLTDGQGRKVFFTNTIIICTSNAGSQIIWEELKSNKKLEEIRIKLLDNFFKTGIFRPEFINRYDAVVIFCPLTKENLLEIAQLMLGSLQKSLKEKGIDFIISQPLKEKVVELSYNPAFGAREMRRVIQDKIENVLAQALLSDKIKRGNKIEITPDFQLVIIPVK